MKVALIFNPFSGGKKSHQFLPIVHREFYKNNISIDMVTSEYHGHLQKIAASLNIEKYDAILSMGGDGTHFHVLNGLLQKNKAFSLPPLGIIPVGTGNSFVKDLDIFTVKESLSAIAQNHYKWVDACSFSQNDQKFYFVNNIGLGFVTDVVKKAQFFKKMGHASYLIGVIIETMGLKFHNLEMALDGNQISEHNCLLAVCNSRYIGGNMLIAPEAQINDGLFDVVILKQLSRFQLLRALPLIFSGEHIHHPSITCMRGKHLKIITHPAKQLSPDGELFGKTPSHVSMHHKFLRYLC